jgi:hypothetical protein
MCRVCIAILIVLDYVLTMDPLRISKDFGVASDCDFALSMSPIDASGFDQL